MSKKDNKAPDTTQHDKQGSTNSDIVTQLDKDCHALATYTYFKIVNNPTLKAWGLPAAPSSLPKLKDKIRGGTQLELE